MNYEGDQVSMFDPDTWSGKTLSAPCQAPEKNTQEKILRQSSRKRSGSQSRKPPLFMCLKRDGRQPDASTTRTESGASHGESWMPSSGACHSDGDALRWLQTSMEEALRASSSLGWNTEEAPEVPVVSRLSDVLEQNPDEKYNLSAKACQGILRRAEKRGKKLPEMLERALAEQVRQEA